MSENLIITKELHPDIGAISGVTHDPIHTWRIRFGPMGHCYLHVDGKYVHHGTLLTCVRYLSGLDCPAVPAEPIAGERRKAPKKKGD